MQQTSNVVNWHEWGRAAFERAKRENKLVLLDITAAWCRWCHVMDKTTYEDSGVIEMLNTRFIPVRVDTDKRPDINARYNVGGWPTTALLTPEGSLITGTTYAPPRQMIEFLEKIDRIFKTDRKKLEEYIHKPHAPKPPSGKAGAHTVELYRSWLEELYDNQHGGFGRAPKFPQPNIYGLLFALAEEGEGWKDRLVLTLQRMAGGLFDQVEGGFFRYATERDWTEPHYEKMLEDNARLLSVYLRAYVNLDDKLFIKTAEKTVAYLLNTLYDSREKYFYGSQDADEEYYRLPAAERAKREPPRVDKTLYTDWNSMAVSALLKASVALNEEEYRRIALETLATILEKSFDGETVYHYYPRDDKTPSTLSDVVWLLNALLDAYQHTLDDEYSARATDVAAALTASFGSDGAFYDVARAEEYGLMSEKRKDADENGAATIVLQKLYTLTEEEKYKMVVDNVLKDLAGLVETRTVFAPQYVEALLYQMKGLVEVKLTGEATGLPTLHKSALARLSERVVVKHEVGEKQGAVVCHRRRCRGPFVNAEELFDALESVG